MIESKSISGLDRIIIFKRPELLYSLMADPMKDGAIRKKQRTRKQNAEKYTPIVLWVKTDYETNRGMVSAEEMIRKKLRETADDMMFVSALTSTEPYSEVITEFDERYEEE